MELTLHRVSDPPEEATLDAARSGDVRALSAILDGLIPDIHRWLLRLLGNRPDLEDAVQDALIEIARAVPQFERRAKISTLAYRITVRVAYRYFEIRKRHHERSLHLVPPSCNDSDPESLLIDREALERLYRCVERLPAKRRMAFLLCEIEGLTPTEAAAIERVSAMVMRSRLKHARREVLRRMSGDPHLDALAHRPRGSQ